MTRPAIDLQEFEHVEAVPGKALLRIVAQPARPLDPAALVLIVKTEGGDHRAAPLPAPASPSGLLRLGFTVPASVADGARGYSLVVADGEPIELPAPTRRQTARLTPALSHSPAPGAAPADTDQALADLSDRLRVELGRRVTAEKAASTSAAARAASAERVELLEAELVKLRDELRQLRDELRESARAVELGSSQASHAREEADAAEEALARRDAEIDLLRGALAERTAELSERTTELGARTAELGERTSQADAAHVHWEQITAELTAEVEMARTETAQFQRHAADLELVLVDTRLQLETMQMIYGDSSDPDERRRTLNAAAAELERLRSEQ
jgi:hypothetical protein